ncbi:uncharacterized protein LOC112088403 [Eutrema salsugineum]|uniref:uncharacterized protein LOC112088403 n=1 Tax=Eutrema salsugineum TaxID=72664 RepID=UPI000CECE3DB|nr:uncharacterized protein LOC112088403 [Eutrema salsugineum]
MYNIMTTNIADSLNSMLNLAREMPIMSLDETIRLTLTTWFHERREKALKHKTLVTPRVAKIMLERYNAAMKLDVFQVDRYKFEVKDETQKYIVHLQNKQCTCLVFDIDRIPCVHAIAAAKRTNKDENKYVDQAYLMETWAKAYAESIHPCGDLKNCDFPDTVVVSSCAPPTCKQTSGRPPTKRKRSVGEFGVPGSKSQ